MSLREFVFKDQMARIKETFGEANYPRPRMEEIWKTVKELPDEEFTRLVTRMVGEIPIRLAPTVKEFREYSETRLKEIRDRANTKKVTDAGFIEKKYSTSDEALQDVGRYFQMITSMEKFPEWLREGFKIEAAKHFPELSADVDRLKEMVKAGSIEARAEYVEKARRLMWRTALKAMFQPKPHQGGESGIHTNEGTGVDGEASEAQTTA